MGLILIFLTSGLIVRYFYDMERIIYFHDFYP